MSSYKIKVFIVADCHSQSSHFLENFLADERGIRGGSLKKTLRETCPTHHTKYK